MKYFTTLINFILIACLVGTMANAQSPRMQLFEYFDNTSIPPFGAVANAHFDSLASANADKMTFIKYHMEYGSQTGTDPMNLHNSSQTATRVLYYSLFSNPQAIQDGAAMGQNTFYDQPTLLTQSSVDDRIMVTSPFNIVVSHHLNATLDSINTRTVITKTGMVNPNAVAHVVVVEKNIHFITAPGMSGDKDFANVMKRMLPTDQGTVLPSMNVGDSVVLNLSWQLANVYDTAQLAVVSFVQDNDTHEVYQAGYAAPNALTFIASTHMALSHINAFPNPFLTTITIKTSIQGNGTLEVFDSYGNRVCAQRVRSESNVEISLGNRPAGVYLVKWRDGKQSLSKRIVKLD